MYFRAIVFSPSERFLKLPFLNFLPGVWFDQSKLDRNCVQINSFVGLSNVVTWTALGY